LLKEFQEKKCSNRKYLYEIYQICFNEDKKDSFLEFVGNLVDSIKKRRVKLEAWTALEGVIHSLKKKF
jgi:hypothetical protein